MTTREISMKSTARNIEVWDSFAFPGDKLHYMKVIRIDHTHCPQTREPRLDVFTSGDTMPFYMTPNQIIWLIKG